MPRPENWVESVRYQVYASIQLEYPFVNQVVWPLVFIRIYRKIDAGSISRFDLFNGRSLRGNRRNIRA